MDRELRAKLDALTRGSWQPLEGDEGGEEVAQLSVRFGERAGKTVVRAESPDGRGFEHELQELEALWARMEQGEPVTPAGQEEAYAPLLMAIESAISGYYHEHPDLKDRHVIEVLQGLVRKPGLVYQGGLRRRIQQHLQLNLSTDEYTRREVTACLRYVLRSAKRHHAVAGPRGYLEFIVDYV